MGKRVSNRKGMPSGNRAPARSRLAKGIQVELGKADVMRMAFAGSQATPVTKETAPIWRRWARRVFGRG